MEIDEEYIDKVKSFIEQKDAENVKALLIDLHPADIAELCNDLAPEEARFVYRLLDNETAADVLVEMDEDVRKEFLELLPSETIAKRFVDYMDTDDAVDLMRELDEDKQEEILSHIEDIEQAGDIVDLLKYDEDTAGGLMGTEMVTVNENWSMPECLKEMRLQAEQLDEIYYVYVIDDDERLQGVFPLKKNDYLSFRLQSEACNEERPHFRPCRHSHRRSGADYREIRLGGSTCRRQHRPPGRADYRRRRHGRGS